MKAMLLLLAILETGVPCLADEILMRDGKSVPFRSIVDQGQTYEVVTPDGKKASIRKAEIERVVVDPTEAPLAGATFTRIAGPKAKTVNALLSVDPKRDVSPSVQAPSVCKVELHGTDLLCDLRCDTPTWVSIATKTPVEYDLTLVLERSDGVSNFYLSLLGGGSVPFLIVFDDSGKSGVWGQKMVPGALFTKGEQATIEIFVRKDSVTVQVNEREIVSWHGKWSDLFVPPDHVPPKGKGLPFIGSQKIFGTVPNLWLIHRMTFTMN